MNYRGSYRKLLGNSISAMVGSIEIYNKPQFLYRNETTVILLVNAWELLFKAIVSKSGKSVYYSKKRNEPYRTIGLEEAGRRATSSAIWPTSIDSSAVVKNVDLLAHYRNSSIHFYSDEDFGYILHSLAQTSVLNYRDLASKVFNRDLTSQINWQILPLGTKPPIDPIDYLKGSRDSKTIPRSAAASAFIAEIENAKKLLTGEGHQPNRLLTIFQVNLQAVKKVSAADFVVGVDASVSDPVMFSRKVDPNLSHPFRQKDILPKFDDRLEMSAYKFQAVAYANNLKSNGTYCWQDASTKLTKWSGETVTFVNRLTADDIDRAITSYRNHIREIQSTQKEQQSG